MREKEVAEVRTYTYITFLSRNASKGNYTTTFLLRQKRSKEKESQSSAGVITEETFHFCGGTLKKEVEIKEANSRLGRDV